MARRAPVLRRAPTGRSPIAVRRHVPAAAIGGEPMRVELSDFTRARWADSFSDQIVRSTPTMAGEVVMAFGLVFLDDSGATWTVGPLAGPVPGTIRGLRFCRPSFLGPEEEYELAEIPAGWPSCSAGELRVALAHARKGRGLTN